MSEQRYKREHLKPYRGILTSQVQNGNFKMVLKVEDNDVLKRSEEIGSSIELDFKYDYSFSPQFFHNIHSCEIENCSKCEEVRGAYYRYEFDISKLQLGDTCEIRAALVNNNCSELPREIRDFKAYGTLLVASPEYYQGPPRLPDTPAGINKKYEREQQRLQREREEEEKRMEDEEKAQKDSKWKKRKESIKQYFGKRPNTNQIIITAVGTTIANQIPNIVKFVKYIYRLLVSN